MHFRDFYSLTYDPFDKTNLKPTDAFLSQDHMHMTSRLGYLVNTGGIGVFTAPSGMGKTFALRCFLSSLNSNLHKSAYVALSTVALREFYILICEELGIEPSSRRSSMFSSIRDYIVELHDAKRQPLVLAVDEAQYLAPPILQDLKILTNFKIDSVNCFSLILIGEPLLNSTLQKPIHEALRQRVAVHYNYQGLTPDETKAYVEHKLRLAGGSVSILAPAAMTALQSNGQGNPRRIDRIMTNALILGASQQQAVLDAETIMQAEANMALC